MIVFPVTSTSDSQAVTSSAASMSPVMATNQIWMFTCSTNCWISQGAAPTAAAADGSMFVPAGAIIMIDGGLGVALSVIRDTADGKASLTRAKVF